MRYFCPAIFIDTCPFLRDVQSGRLNNFSGNILTIGFMILCALQQRARWYLFSCIIFLFSVYIVVFSTTLRSAESALFFSSSICTPVFPVACSVWYTSNLPSVKPGDALWIFGWMKLLMAEVWDGLETWKIHEDGGLFHWNCEYFLDLLMFLLFLLKISASSLLLRSTRVWDYVCVGQRDGECHQQFERDLVEGIAVGVLGLKLSQGASVVTIIVS